MYPIRSAQITAFIASLRRVVRIIWSQQLALAEGFDESIVRVLRLRCVGAFMLLLARLTPCILDKRAGKALAWPSVTTPTVIRSLTRYPDVWHAPNINATTLRPFQHF